MKKTLTDRVAALEVRTDDIRDELNEVRDMVIQIDKAFEKHQKWLSNGFSDKIAAQILGSTTVT